MQNQIQMLQLTSGFHWVARQRNIPDISFPKVTSQMITIRLSVSVPYEVSCTFPTYLLLQSVLAKPYLMADVTNTLEFASAKGPTRVSFTTFNANLGALCVGHFWNVMAPAQKPDLVFRRNGRVHLNRRGGGRSSVDYWQPMCARRR